MDLELSSEEIEKFITTTKNKDKLCLKIPIINNHKTINYLSSLFDKTINTISFNIDMKFNIKLKYCILIGCFIYSIETNDDHIIYELSIDTIKTKDNRITNNIIQYFIHEVVPVISESPSSILFKKLVSLGGYEPQLYPTQGINKQKFKIINHCL